VKPVQARNRGDFDAFVATLNPDGSALVYSTYLGGGGVDYGYGIAVDSFGNAYVTGRTYSADFPSANPLQASYGGELDAFVAKLNATGSALVYSTYLGGSRYDEGNSIAVDSSGNAYVTGVTYSTNFPTASAFQATCGGCSSYADAFVAKLNAIGSALVYSTYLGGGGVDYGYGIAVDSLGNAYVTGETSSTDFPVAHPLQPSAHGSFDVFVTKISSVANPVSSVRRTEREGAHTADADRRQPLGTSCFRSNRGISSQVHRPGPMRALCNQAALVDKFRGAVRASAAEERRYLVDCILNVP
jgi:hypothetical protein